MSCIRSLGRMAVLCLAALCSAAVGLHMWHLDGLVGWLLAPGFEESTVYAPGYSDGGFRRVRVGMTPEQVVLLIGEPLKKQRLQTVALGNGTVIGGPGESWIYTVRERDTSYRVRVVVFLGGKVIERISEFYVD